MNMQMQDPSQGIQRELQGHVHLVSTYRFPSLSQLHPDKVAEYLLGAPKITRDQAPFYWTYLDRPADGTVLLIWQSASLGPEFPSDGYVWNPGESPYAIDVPGGYTLEMYQQKTGFAPGEPFATHSRRRYRLMPSRTNPGNPSPDPALWIIHYTQCDPNDRIPANVIPIDMRIQQIMSTRQYLQSHGQIVQKEFMLHDRNKWPTISFPRGPPRGAPMYGASAPQARIPQTMAYPAQQHAVAGPPAKRVRTQTNVNQAAAISAAAMEPDDEEDYTRGDLFDLMTPRDISMARYKQNHEWMEEILSSPYAIHQIIPTDLGLGMRGELGALTEGIFDAPYNPLQAYFPRDIRNQVDNDPAKQERGVFFTPYHSEDKDAPKQDVPKNIYVGRLDADKAEEFRKRANEKIAETNAEIEKMKAKHAKRLAKFKKGSLITHAEKQLRIAVEDPTDTGPEFWRLEGRIDEDAEEGGVATEIPPRVSDIVAQVEASVGRHAAAVKELIRIQDGGYEEVAPRITPPAVTSSSLLGTNPHASYNGSYNGSNGSAHSGALVDNANVDTSNSAAGLLDQYQPSGPSSNATPGTGSNFPTPQPHYQHHSSANTPGNVQMASPHPPPPPQQQQSVEISMGNTEEQRVPSDTTGGDWVIVPPGGVSPQNASNSPAFAQPSTQPQFQHPSISEHNPSPMPTSTSGNTPQVNDFHTSPNDFADLGDLEGAEGAMGSYGGDGADMGNLELDMDGGEGVDDSAFGDAFHGVEQRGEDEDGGMGEGL
ncbi:hypothetical protein LZ554_008037 [Drepanopeziza brunnea f. sp. 'monogermtubi']|nr:hypothetical protein LZ554_008037 [Drepanopeziza brunnea f. sp. 'monogermtubi']